MPDDPETPGKDEESFYPIVIDIGVTGADPACFVLCETPALDEEDQNGITGVTDHGDGTYTIALEHGLRSNYVTTIEYLGSEDYVQYIHHPANADGSSVANAADITVVVDCLNSPGTCENYVADIDASDVQGANDIIEEIDLLNGDGQYDPWFGTSRPENLGDCPAECPPSGGGGDGGGAGEGGGRGAPSAPDVDEDEPPFGPWFVEFLMQANQQGAPAMSEFIITVEALTGWCAEHLTSSEKAELVALLTDPEAEFADEAVEALVPRIVAALQ